MARMNFVPFAGIVSIGVIALAGCGSSGSTTGLIGGGGGSGGIGATSTAAAAGGAVAGAGSWVLSAPSSVFGFPQIQPSASALAKIKQDLERSAASLGVSGTQVIGVYDDRPHGLYLIFAGYNGHGFDPARLRAQYITAPVTTGDGTTFRMVINNITIDPGPHGGSAGCNSVMGQSAVGTTEATSCSWMTTTTTGSISTYTNMQHPNVTAVGPDVMGKAMRDLRDQVEHRS